MLLAGLRPALAPTAPVRTARSRRGIGATLALATLVLLAIVACDGNSNFTFPALEGQPDDTDDVQPTPVDAPPTSADTQPTPAEVPSDPSDAPFETGMERTLPFLLTRIPLPPDGERWRSVYLNDYERMREAHGIRAPQRDAGGAATEEYLSRVFEETGTTGPWLSGYHPLARGLLDGREYLRFDVSDVARSIWAETPPRTIEVMTGRFDPKAIGRWLAACGECPEPDILEHRGVEFYGWGEDLEIDPSKSLHPPAFDQLGRGGRIAVLDSFVLRSLDTEGLRGLIDSYRGTRSFLADDPDMLMAAQTLDELGAYSALLIGDVTAFDEVLEIRRNCNVVSHCAGEEDVDRMRSLLGMAPESGALDRYNLLGTGVGHNEDGLYTVLVFVYENEDVTEHNVEVLKENLAEGYWISADKPWTEVFPHSEVWNNGRALIAKLRTEDRFVWASMVSEGASLLTWN